ncbi:MAG: cytochrome c oxidase subunit [Candidatus Eremiobacteraeota bacterium]|jgi:cytochrome c oxidase subunit 1|nr:cytochrome c oxidase subunit [Candidatus Eremiobacteraeota bacterium]
MATAIGGRRTADDALELSRASGDLLVLTHIYTSTLVLGVGALFGMLQGLSRANFIVMPPWFDYYRMLTAHGVLMALVFTTFFITGLFTYSTYKTIPRVRSTRLGWIGYCVMLVGTLMAAVAILDGSASVLYTFYAPLKASPVFYFGATFLVLGTWLVAADIFLNVAWFKASNRGLRIPLPAFIATCTMTMWIIATLGVVAEMCLLIPWSLGWTNGIDVGLTRMFFWYFGHPLVYFWIMAAYAIWYTVVPETFRGKIFSDGLTRLAFIMLLLLSTPVGLHHQYLDPGISAGWKWMHTVTTYGVVIPSFMTAFAIFATFELAARKAGVRGFFNTVRWLPWKNPVFAGPALGMILFIFGGFGGVVNNSYSMDVLVHNTMWIVGHFHITVGGPAALTFIGATYGLIPALTGRQLFAPKLALIQVYTWFFGMSIMSIAMHWAGLLGSPRRTADVSYFGAQGAATWHTHMVWAAIGGTIVAISVLMFIIVATGTYVASRRTAERPTFEFASTNEDALETPPVLDRLGRWGAVALGLAVLAYAGPVIQQINAHAYLAPGMRTW